MKRAKGPVYITPDASNYMEEWVALSPDFQEVLGHGKTTTEAAEMAEKSKYGFGILFFMSESWNDLLVV